MPIAANHVRRQGVNFKITALRENEDTALREFHTRHPARSFALAGTCTLALRRMRIAPRGQEVGR